jgi:hypothetical protein
MPAPPIASTKPLRRICTCAASSSIEPELSITKMMSTGALRVSAT